MTQVVALPWKTWAQKTVHTIHNIFRIEKRRLYKTLYGSIEGHQQYFCHRNSKEETHLVIDTYKEDLSKLDYQLRPLMPWVRSVCLDVKDAIDASDLEPFSWMGIETCKPCESCKVIRVRSSFIPQVSEFVKIRDNVINGFQERN